jgi:hypothetical protein
VKQAFVAPLMNGLPFAFGKPITIGATSRCRSRPCGGSGWKGDNDFGKGMGNAEHGLLRLNEGVGEHVRTRSHRVRRSPVTLRTSSDPHRTKKGFFLLPDRLREEVRSSRLT